MATSPVDLKKIAHELSQSGGESYIRAAVSKAYYCAYHYCLQHLPDVDRTRVENVSVSTHRALIDCYSAGTLGATVADAKRARDVGYALGVMRALRVKADYHLDVPFGRSYFKQVFENLEVVESNLVRLPKS